MEELSEGLLKGLFRLIRFILIEAMCEFLFYWIGRLFLLMITLGRYPRGNKVEDDELFIIVVGIVFSVVSVICISYFL